MKVFIIDETDRQRDREKNKAYFVLCGLIIDADDIVKTSDELGDILDKHHIKTLKTARKGGLSKAQRNEITEEVFSVLKKYNVEARAIYLGEYTMRTKREVSDTYLGALDFLIERYFLSLKRDNTTGLVVMDNLSHKTESELRKKFYKHIKNEGQTWITSNKTDPYKRKICAWLLFSNDDDNVLLQATDLIAASLNGAIWKSISDDDFKVEELPQKNEFLDTYWPLFAKSASGKVSGWGVKIWN